MIELLNTFSFMEVIIIEFRHRGTKVKGGSFVNLQECQNYRITG